MAARTHTYTAPAKGAASKEGRSNHRATLAVLCGLVSVIAIPLAIWLTRRVAGAEVLDAVWAVPVAAISAVASLVLARRGRQHQAVEPSRRLMTARVLAVTGVCLTLSSALAVGIYEFLVWKETH